MNPQLIQTAAANCELMKGISPGDIDLIVRAGRQAEFAKGTRFFNQGEDSRVMYLLVEGRARLTQLSPDGEQVIVDYFGPGQGLGIIVSLNGTPYPLSAEAVEECRAVAWSRETMRGLMMDFPRLALNALDMIGRRFVQLQERYQEAATMRVEQRVARALLRLVRQFGRRAETGGVLIDMPLTRQELAEITGTNLYNVSRILSKWEQNGYIASNQKRITLVRSHEIVLIAEDLASPAHEPKRSEPA